jgi:hypothetical protein
MLNSDKNIIDIHNDILTYFDKEEKRLPIIKKRLDELHYILDNETFIDRVKNKIQIEIDEIESEYNKIASKEDMHFYLLNIIPFLEKYKVELAKPIELNFMGNVSTINTKLLEEYRNIFLKYAHPFINNYSRTCHSDDYLSTTQAKNNYSQGIGYLSSTSQSGIHLNSDSINKSVCPNCFNKSETITNTNIITCDNCGMEKEVIQTTFSYKDTERINVTSKYIYERRIHFRDCINQFQGKQNSTIKQDVYDKLIEQFTLHGLVVEGDVPKQIKFEKVTKYHVSLFLKEIGFSSHYEDLNLIYHNITGNALDDITHLEEILMNDFDTLSEKYNEQYIKTKKIDRKNFINTQYVLYQLLRRHKYPCSKNDFSFLKTIERKHFHDEICSDLFRRLEWKFTEIF